MNDLVSIIMLSKNQGQYVEESVKSVLTQTYPDWELLIVDDASDDDTISRLVDLKGRDARIKITQNVGSKGVVASVNSALRKARGRWMAFIDAGDLWEPDKLERQVAFMKENGYEFSYTNYKVVDEKRGSQQLVSGPKVITISEMEKCYWPGYLTVMYAAQRLNLSDSDSMKRDNDYALWILINEHVDCYLLDEYLATNMKQRNNLRKLPVSEKFRWRYEAFRFTEQRSALSSVYMTLRNLCYTMVKFTKYTKPAPMGGGN